MAISQNTSPTSDELPMRLPERLFHACLFELGAIVLTIGVFAIFGSHGNHAGALAVVISVIAVLWNMGFNWVFDKLFVGERLSRTLGVRLLHMSVFEGGLFLVTVPLIAYTLGVSLWQAFVMDIGIVAVIGVYTLLYNWIYDYGRAYFLTVKQSKINND